jgi:peroxiredoxin
MRRLPWLVLGLAALLVLAPVHAQDKEEPAPADVGDDANPFNLSNDEQAALKKFNELETQAIRSLQERDFETAERRYTRLISKLEKDDVVNDVAKRRMLSYAHYNLACNYSLNKQKTEALAELDKSLEFGFWDWKHFKKDTDLDNIRDEDEYKATIKKWRRFEAQSYVDEEARLVAQVTSSLAAKPVVKRYDFTLTSKKGDELQRSELKGSVIVLAVLNIWETPAAPEVALLVRLHAEYKRQGVLVIGVVPYAGELPEQADKFIEENEIKFKMCAAHPADPALVAYNKSYGKTRFLFLDKRGKVRGTAEKLKNYDAVEETIKLLLAAPETAPEKKPAEPQK